MKMLLWTLPGATLHVRESAVKEPAHMRLQSDFDFLKTHLASEKLMACGGVNLQTLNVFTNQFLRSLTVAQQPAAVSSAVALAELLSQISLDADDAIKTLLRGFVRVNRVLSEAAYVVPIAALPPTARAGRDESALVVHAARQRISDNLSSRTSEIDVNSTHLLEWEYRHKQLELVQENLLLSGGLANVHKSDAKTVEDETSNRRPTAILEKYCEFEDASLVDVATADLKTGAKQWRILLGFLTHQTTK